MTVPSDDEIATKMVEFGDMTRHKTLIFDMDETLIHSQIILPNTETDFTKDFDICLPNGGKFAISIRPYAKKCLEHLS